MSDYTPTLEVVRDAVTFPRERLGEPRPISGEAFDRFIAKIKADARAKGMFRFKGRAVTVDDSGYYYARWDTATPVEALASTRDEAFEKAFAMLGESDRRGFSWRIKWDSIEEKA